MNATKRILIALYLPKIVALLIVFGRHVVQAMTSSPWFTGLAVLLTTTTTDLDALEAAGATALTRAKGAAAARDLKKRAVVADLFSLKSGVETIVAQNPAQEASTIIEAAGMSERKVAARSKQDLAAAMGTTPGEVLVRAKAVRGASYEWQYSLDGGVNWLSMGTTTVASTSVLGMKVGTTVLFRFRTTLKRTTTNWSQTISFFVH